MSRILSGSILLPAQQSALGNFTAAILIGLYGRENLIYILPLCESMAGSKIQRYGPIINKSPSHNTASSSLEMTSTLPEVANSTLKETLS